MRTSVLTELGQDDPDRLASLLALAARMAGEDLAIEDGSIVDSEVVER